VAFNFPDLEYVNFSSGFGVRYSKEDKDFDFQKVIKHYSYLGNKLSKSYRRDIILKIEPGRILLADAGSLLVKITNIKKLNSKKSEISVDAGFAELARPKIYNSYHEIENLERKGNPKKVYDIRGNTALQNDFLGRDRRLEETREGDYLLIKKVGAYGYVMASGFPGKNLPGQVLINKDKIVLF
jgi:diaminopimelate decarboxylase